MKPSPSHLAYIFLGVFLVTIFSLQWWQLEMYPFWVIAVVGGATTLTAVGSIAWKHKRALLLPLLAGCLGCLIAFQTVSRTKLPPPSPELQSKQGKDVTVQGKIAKEPEKQGDNTNYTISAQKILEENGDIISVQGLILASDSVNEGQLDIGAEVVVRGKFLEPEAWMKKDGIQARIAKAVLTPTNQERARNILTGLITLKRQFDAKIASLYPEPHASLLSGLLTGTHHGLPKPIVQAFQATGLSHIVAISGYNITIIISLIAGLFAWMPYRWRFVPAVAIIIGFTFFVGASPSVVRAAIMGVLGLLALQVERMESSRLTVLWTLFFMITWNPRYLWYDIGFQLSFLSVLGVMEIAPLLNHWFRNVPESFGIRDIFFTTIAVQLFSVPWIVFLFGKFSIIAPIANVLTSPFIPLAMFFGFISTLISWVLPLLGKGLALFGWGALQGIILIATGLSKVPYASLEIPHVHGAFVIVYYVLLGLALVWIRSRRSLILSMEENSGS
jgi:competence protein ComEC